ASASTACSPGFPFSPRLSGLNWNRRRYKDQAMSRCIAFIVCALCASSSFAQIYYEPVRYQYSACDRNYFYGGSDPRVLAHANYYACNTHFKRSLHNFDGGTSFDEPAPFFDYEAVYMDSVPRMDARHFGYTESDARNAAYA